MALSNGWLWGARVAKLVALLLFFVPWLAVSCNDQTLIQATGMQLVTGTPEVAENMVKPVDIGAAWWAITALVLIVAGLLGSFVFRNVKTSGRVVLLSSVLALVVLTGGVTQTIGKLKSELEEATSSSSGGNSQKELERQLAAMLGSGIEIDVKAGFHWLFGVLIVSAGCGVGAQFGRRARPEAPVNEDRV